MRSHALLVACCAVAWAAAPSPASAASCGDMGSFFQISVEAGFGTFFHQVRTRRIGCRAARRVLKVCGASPYPPKGWRGTLLHGRREPRFVLRSGKRRISYGTAADSIPPCANSFPRRPSGLGRGPWMLSPRGLNTLTVGSSLRDAERSSGLDFRSFGLGCARSWVNRRIEISLGAEDSENPYAVPVAQVMVTDPAIPTTAGLRVGDPLARVGELYGAQATFVGNLEVGQGTDFVIAPVDAPEHEYAIWTSDGRVALIVAGLRGRTAADEYCA